MRLNLVPDRIFMLKALSGERTIANSSGSFRYRDIFEYIAPDFYLKFTQCGLPTGITEMTTYEVETDKGGNFEEMFSKLSGPLTNHCLNQDQLLELCIFHEKKPMPNGVPNLILLNLYPLASHPDDIVVVDLRVGRHGLLGMNLRPLSSGDFLEPGQGLPFYHYLLVPSKPQS